MAKRGGSIGRRLRCRQWPGRALVIPAPQGYFLRAHRRGSRTRRGPACAGTTLYVGYVLKWRDIPEMRKLNSQHFATGLSVETSENMGSTLITMRTVKLIGFGLALSLPAMALAASIAPVSDERALREEFSAVSQAEMRDCLAKKAEDSRKALQQAEETVADTLSKWDEDSKFVSQAKAKLARSNKEFAEYRESQCRFAASLSGGGAGNAHEMRRLACAAELNNRRAEQLHDAVYDMPLK